MQIIDLKELKTKNNDFLSPEEEGFYIKTPGAQIEVKIHYNDEREYHDSDDSIVWTTQNDSGASIEDLIKSIETQILQAADTLDAEQIKAGAVVEMKNTNQSFFYKVLDVPNNSTDRFKVQTEDGARYYKVEDFYSVSDKFDFEKINIKKENIHLYYQFMSDEDMKNIKNKYIISDALCTRFYSICDIIFKDEKPENINKYVVDIMNGDLQKEQILFSIKDTMQPIDEYISEIKQSPGYQEYKLLEKRTSEMRKEEKKEFPQTTNNKNNYMMLSRLQSDCEYFIGHGNGNLKHLYHDTVEEHINEMKKLWNHFAADTKPEWLTMQDIEEYKTEMLNVNSNRSFFEVNEYLNARQEKKQSNTKAANSPTQKIENKNDLNNYMPNLKAQVAIQNEAKYILQKLEKAGTIYNLYFDDERVIFKHNEQEYKLFEYDNAINFIKKDLAVVIPLSFYEDYKKEQSLQAIQTDPELETPEGLKKARENLEYRLSQEQQNQDYK